LGKNLRKKRGEPKKYNYIVRLRRNRWSGKVTGSTYLGVEIFSDNDMMLFKLANQGVISSN